MSSLIELCVKVCTPTNLYSLNVNLCVIGDRKTLTVRSPEFNKILQNAIDDALVSLGESVKQAIYFHIDVKFKVPKDNISENLEEFQSGLEKIFGAGARFIEILIMRNLHAKIGLSLDVNGTNLEFIKYVNAAEQSYLSQSMKIIPCEGMQACTD